MSKLPVSLKTLRKLIRLGFLELDATNKTLRLHPRWVGVSEDDLAHAIAVALGDMHAH